MLCLNFLVFFGDFFDNLFCARSLGAIHFQPICWAVISYDLISLHLSGQAFFPRDKPKESNQLILHMGRNVTLLMSSTEAFHFPNNCHARPLQAPSFHLPLTLCCN